MTASYNRRTPALSTTHRGNAMVHLTGRNLAYSNRTASQRAALAAALVAGDAWLVRPTVKQAAALTGVSAVYVHAALKLRATTRDRVAAGELDLSDAARANGLAAAYLDASSDERIAFAKAVGVAELWDDTIVPAMND
jgi:hypothetical protein